MHEVSCSFVPSWLVLVRTWARESARMMVLLTTGTSSGRRGDEIAVFDDGLSIQVAGVLHSMAIRASR